MKCRQVTQLISKHQENPLTLLEQGQVYLHLAICPYCRAFHKNSSVNANVFCARRTSRLNLPHEVVTVFSMLTCDDRLHTAVRVHECY